MALVWNILVWIVFGLIAGAVAQFIMPGRDPGQSMDPKGFAITTLLGIAGAAIGGALSSLLFGWGVDGFDLRSFVVAIIGALLLLLVYRLVMGTRRTW
jgi:uncharacterized membrane protein YeaQ/YmgE (transglycosylase-associated protein family)